MNRTFRRARVRALSPILVALAPMAVISVAAADARAQARPTAAGPAAESTSLWDILMALKDKTGARQLTSDQEQALGRLRIHKDRLHPGVVYWTAPMNIAAPVGAPAFTERANVQVLEAAESVDTFLRALQNEAAWTSVDQSKVKTAIMNPTDSTTPAADNTSATARETAGALRRFFDDFPAETKLRFVATVRIALTRAGLTVPPQLNFDTALDEAAVLFKTATSVNLSVPVGFGLDPELAEAFLVLRQGMPEITFVQLPSAPSWTLQQQGVMSDRAEGDKVGENVLEPTLKMHQDAFTNLGQARGYEIAAGGGVMTVGLNYGGALAYGYGELDNADPLVAEGRRALREYLPGFLSQRLAVNVQLQGTARCRFRAEVKLDKVIALEKRNGLAVALDRSRAVGETTADSGPAINECEILDASGKPVSMADPKIATMAEAARSRHVADKLNLYLATVGLKNTIREAAQRRADGWKMLPMPTEAKLIREWQSHQSCRPERTNQYCAAIKESKFLGITYDRHCSRWEYNFRQHCDTYYRAMDRFVQVPVNVTYFSDRASFNKVWDEVSDYPISAASPVTLVVANHHSVCLQRDSRTNAAGERTFIRTRCELALRNEASKKTDLDLTVPDVPPDSQAGVGLEVFKND